MPAEDLNANPAQAEFLKGVICKLIESDVDRCFSDTASAQSGVIIGPSCVVPHFLSLTG